MDKKRPDMPNWKWSENSPLILYSHTSTVVLMNCPKLTPHIKQPLHLSQPWLERGGENWLCQAVHMCGLIWSAQPANQANTTPLTDKETDVLRSDIPGHRVLRMCWNWVQIQAFSNTKYMLFLFTFVWHWEAMRSLSIRVYLSICT